MARELDESQVELCPLDYAIGPVGTTVPWDKAFYRGEWEELKGKRIAINIRTVIRNARSSYQGEDTEEMGLTDRVREDMLLIKEYFSDQHDAEVYFYSIRYGNTKLGRLPNFRIPKTDKQKHGAKIEKRVYRDIRDELDGIYDSKVEGVPDYIISHIMYDMVTASSRVKLIETHTGAIKSGELLADKLNLNDMEYMAVPFNMMTYVLYGDGAILNKNTKVTRSLINTLLAANITPLSTESRFTMAVKMRDPILYNHIRKMF